ncbi:Serpin domain-containing protein [Aspergillus pseudoustus]|uniref:Serpin domain-containing protein n=1 Tax=Aspergillus pseudoustus TaxID=1810923 RepID=A0ABR4K637_9EURO
MSTRTRQTRAVINKINQLGWNVVSRLCANNNNGVPPDGAAVSALSITTALAMLAGGATGTHRDELCSSLGLQQPDEITTVLPNVLETLNSDAIRFKSANALFTTSDTEVYPEYIEYLQQLDAHIDSGFTTLADGVDQINGWIEKGTDGLIRNMLSRDSLALAHMVLVNALVFKAKWENAFEPEYTISDHPFHTTKKVDMMFRHQEYVLVHEREEYTAVRLPYVSTTPSSEWSFVAYLPSEGKSVQDIIPHIHQYDAGSFTRTKLAKLGLPKFNLQTNDSIKPILEELGYPLSGNFSAMGTGANLVEQIIHSVTIILDEEGTEAAAATAVMMARGRPRPLPSIVFDRPFAFSIVAEDLGIALFTGVFSVA